MSFGPSNYNGIKVKQTSIPGLLELDLAVMGDKRGWFKENYQKEKMEALGLPAFEIVQNNFSYNQKVGVTRGLHAEPWEKFISLGNGSVFGAWVDLREGPTFGKTFSLELNPGKAVFVPRGVANGYQTLEENVVYSYLVNAYWSSSIKYVSVDLFDQELAINWPIDKERAIVSEKDQNNPSFKSTIPWVVS